MNEEYVFLENINQEYHNISEIIDGVKKLASQGNSFISIFTNFEQKRESFLKNLGLFDKDKAIKIEIIQNSLEKIKKLKLELESIGVDFDRIKEKKYEALAENISEEPKVKIKKIG